MNNHSRLKTIISASTLIIAIYIFIPHVSDASLKIKIAPWISTIKSSLTQIKVNSSLNKSVRNGLLILYSFDGPDVVSETTYDRSGQTNNGVTDNFSTSTTPIAGKTGQGLYFDGLSIKVTSNSDVAIQDNDARTMSAWGKLDEDVTNGVMMSLGTGSNNTLFAPSCLSGTWQVNGYGVENDLDTAVACDNKLHMHTVTLSGTTLTYYLDGVSIGVFDHTFSTPLGPLIVGARNDDGNTRWQGIIDDVRIYNRALSSTEINLLYRLAR